jgi:hypothetical protein
MDGSIDTLAALIATAADALADILRRFDVALLAAGLALHLVADVVRNGGWYGVLRAAGPEHEALRLRDVQAATFGGGAVNALVPARVGDLVKLAIVRRRVPESRMATLATTLLPETLFEWLVGATLLTWALVAGYLPARVVADALAGAAAHPVVAAVVLAASAAALAAAAKAIRRRAARLSRDLAAGVAVLRRPHAFLTGVVSWQLAGRVIRLGAIACCLSACHLPGGLAAAAVAMAIDGGTRLHFAPASAGLRVGMLVYALPAATGTAVSLGAVVTYLAVVKTARTATSLAIGAGVLAATFGPRSPRGALAALRAVRAAAPVEAPAAEAPAVSR